MGALGRRRQVLALILLVAEALFWAVLALAGYAFREVNLGAPTNDYVSKATLAAEIFAIWAVAHLLVAAAAAISRGAAWRVSAGAVQLIDIAVLVYAVLNAAPNRVAGEVAISWALALVPLAGTAIALAPLRSPPITGSGPR